MLDAPTINQFREVFGTHLPIPGRWNGNAYNYHPHGFILKPMVYVDHHNTNGYCDAFVMTDPQSDFHPIASDRDASISGSRGQALPRPKNGKLVRVYSCGEWIGPSGPWRLAMVQDLDKIQQQIVDIMKIRKQRQNEAKEMSRKMADRDYENAALAFNIRSE